MWTPVRAAAALLLAAALTGAASAPASAASSGADSVGGPALATRGRVLPVGAPPVPPEVVAHGWLVADLDTGAVLGAQDPHGTYAPASTLKTLTAVTLMPRLDPATKLVPEFDDVAVDGSKVGLVERVGYPVSELFKAMLMVSANDAASVLARAAGGPAAIEAMNEEAARLQADDTHAVNPHGLDAPGQVSSPYDLALIARAGMAIPQFREDVATLKGSVSGPGGKRIETYNHDKLLRRYDGAIGIKNGYTSAAKASFVGAATRDGRTLVVTLMRTRPQVDVEAAKLLDWGFATAAAEVPPVGQLVDPLPAPSEQVAKAAVQEPLPAALRAPAAPRNDDGSHLPVQLGSGAAVLVAVVLLRRRRLRG